jgi:hypothetical protein
LLFRRGGKDHSWGSYIRRNVQLPKSQTVTFGHFMVLGPML